MTRKDETGFACEASVVQNALMALADALGSPIFFFSFFSPPPCE